MKKNIIIIVLIIIIAFGGCFFYLNNKKTKQIENKQTETSFVIPSGAIIGRVQTDDSINYKLDVSKYESGTVYYKLANNTVVSLDFYETDDDFYKNFSISVNGLLVNIDSNAFNRKGTLCIDKETDTIDIALLGNYLIFDNYFWTDIRSITVYIFNMRNNEIKSIGEMEKINGMVPSSKEIVNKEGIIVSGSRISHGPSIIYDGKEYDVCGEPSKIDFDDIVSADYFYKLENGKIDFDNPIKTNIVNSGKFVSKTVRECQLNN